MNVLSQPQPLAMQLVAFPSFGYLADNNRWRVQIEGVIRQPYSPTIRKRVVLRILGNVLGISEDELLSDAYFPRIMPFVSDGAKHKEIRLAVGGHELVLPRRSKSNGHFSQTVYLSSKWIEANRQTSPSGRDYLDIRLACDGAAMEASTARVFLIPNRGLSVISDIDDTIKNSAINDRRELLANTFLRPFQSVEGMADVYRGWGEQGADFHYISSSPWQLLPPISEMLARDRFPSGSVHLRYFRLRNHMLQRMVRIKRSGKITSLRHVVKTMGGRDFLLVGDSGEKDLELYRSLVKRFGPRIVGVCIRNLDRHPLSQERIERFRQTHRTTPLVLFRSAEELAEGAAELVGGLSSSGTRT